MNIRTIYLYLPEEAVDCWRPCQAEHLGDDRYRILDDAPDDEVWEFKKGDIVRCRMTKLISVTTPDDCLVAFELAP